MAYENEIEAAKKTALEKYPILQNLGLQAGFDTGPGRVEFFPPDEQGSPHDPRPVPLGMPYISIRDPSLINPDVFLGEGMHYLPHVDPKFAAFREKIRQSLTPEQLLMSRKRYQTYQDPRPYEDFFERSDLDAFIRGYLAPDEADEWRKSGTYTDDQIRLLEFLRAYLQQVGPR